jgi:hypothetical protein
MLVRELLVGHLRDVNLSWTRHLKFAWGLAWKLFLLSLTALVHGIFPFILVTSASDRVIKMADEFKQDTLSRHPH